MIDTNARTTAKQRVHELSYGKDRDDKDELLTVLDNIAAEWQTDKDELTRQAAEISDLTEKNLSLLEILASRSTELDNANQECDNLTARVADLQAAIAEHKGSIFNARNRDANGYVYGHIDKALHDKLKEQA